LLSESRHSGGAASYFLPPPAAAEENGPSFEKVFAEFLSGVNKREAEDRAAGTARERRAREEAAEFQAARNQGETGTVREAQEAESPAETEAAGGVEDRGGAGVSWGPKAAAETVQEISGSAEAGLDGGPAEEDSEEGGDFLLAEAPEPFPFPAVVVQSPAPEAEAALDVDLGPVKDAGGPAEGWKAAAYSAAEGLPSLRESRPNVKTASAAAAGEAEDREGFPAGDSPELSVVPEEEAGGPSPGAVENRAAFHHRENPAPPQRDRITPDPGLGYSAAVRGEGESSRISASLGRTAEERGPEKTREGRGNTRRRVELRDYREKTPEPPPGPSQTPPAGQPEAARFRETSPVDLISRDLGGGGERAAAPREDAGAFEELLARELRQNLNSDIVRHAQVILRDKGEGIIRLSLKPESLGNVKIRLELTENKIAGRIIVESGEALRAFEREIASLERSFRDSGYESAELNAFLAQDQGSGGGGAEERPFYSPRFAADKAASRYDETLERTDTSFPGFPGNGLGPGNGHIQVNILI
jgi:hypothetical protein